MTWRRATAVSAALALLSAGVRPAFADAEARAVVDRIAVRFYSPETGGVSHPRFISERVLAFEGRLDAMSDEIRATGQTPSARSLKNALERHVVEEILATLDETSASRSSDDAPLAREARADVADRAGGEGPIGIAAEEEGLDGDEILEIFSRRARAAAYLDRAVTRFLHPEDEQLREVFRTSAHPFRGRPFDQVRSALSRWFVIERVRVAETAFFQGARTRVVVIVTR